MPKVKLDWVQCETFRSENAFKKSKEKNYKNLKVGKTSVNNCNVTGCDSGNHKMKVQYGWCHCLNSAQCNYRTAYLSCEQSNIYIKNYAQVYVSVFLFIILIYYYAFFN